MKKTITLISFLLTLLFVNLTFAQEFTDWKWSHQKPQGNRISWVKMWDANNWYAVGFVGTFMKTTNAGATWYFHHKAGKEFGTSGQSINLYDAHFFDQQVGVAIGTSSTVYRTTDAGVTWTPATLPTGLSTTLTLYQIHFYNATHGFISGSSGTLLKTTDAGLNWESVTTGVTSVLYDVFSADGTNIYLATTSKTIRRSTDGGTTWTAVDLLGTTFTVWKVHFLDANNGYATGASSQCRYTSDGGTTWVDVSAGLPASATFYDIDNIGSNVYLTGNSFFIYKSTNNGANWDTLGFLAPVADQPWTSTRYATDFGATEDDFLVVGAFGLINKKYQTFTKFQRAGIIYDVWAESGTGKVITVGAPSAAGSAFDQFFYSTNGGTDWNIATTTFSKPSSNQHYEVLEQDDIEETKENQLAPSSYASFWSIDMIDSQIGWAVGTLGAVYKTTNGGVTWDSVAVPIIPGTLTLRKVEFVNANVGWIFSSSSNTNGTIWKTTDGGANWTQQFLTGTTTTGGQIYESSMINENLGWIVNYTPRPYVTTDGGATWTVQNLVDNFGGFLYDIHMFDANVGYACGSSGRVYKTTNGGTNWDTLTVPTRSYSFNKLVFYDVNYGMVVGSSGHIIKTTDGGATWEVINNSGATNNSVALVKNSGSATPSATIFTVGSNSYIHKMTNYALPPVYNAIWQRSVATSSLPAWFGANTERGLAFGSTSPTDVNPRVFVVSRNAGSFVKILDANTGADVGDLNTTGITGGTFHLNDVEVSSDGKIFAANMTLNASTDTFRVYMWTNEAATAVPVIKWLGADAVRLGDKFTVVGDYSAGTAVLYAGSATANQYKVYKWTMTGGTFNQTPETILLGGITTGTPTSASIAPLPNGSFYWKATGFGLYKYQSDGTLIGIVPTTIVASGGNAVRYLGNIGNKEYVAVYQYGTTTENARILEIPTDDVPGAVTYALTLQLGNATNTNGSGDVAYRFYPEGNVDVFVLGTNNGLGCYRTVDAIPVELLSLSATANGNDVLINWSTATESNSQEFQVERKTADQNNWSLVGKVTSAGTSTEIRAYSYTDRNVNSGKYSYRLKMVDFDGTFEYSQTINVEVGSPVNFALSQNYPNPFNPMTRIDYQLANDSKVTVELFDITGQKVATLINEDMKAGYYSVNLNSGSYKLSTGVYIYRMIAINNVTGKSFVDSKKLMLLK